LDFLLSLSSLIINILDRIPFNVIKLYSPDLITILLYYLAILIVLRIIDIFDFKASLKKVISLYLVILIGVSVIGITLDDHIEIDFIDVGQGDSILIKTHGYRG
jgi:competence protein ComEC